MMLKKIAYAMLAAALLVLQVAPPAIAAYNFPATIGQFSGDCATSGANSYVTTCTKFNGTPFGSSASLGIGFEGNYNKITSGASYTTVATDQVICINKTTGSATAVTLTLPGTVPAGQVRVWRVKDCKGDAATNNITVSASSGNIDGSATLVMSQAYQGAEFRYDGTTVSAW